MIHLKRSSLVLPACLGALLLGVFRVAPASPVTHLVFFITILFAAWLGGFFLGLAATLCGIIIICILTPPSILLQTGNLVATSVLIIEGVLLSIIGAYKSAGVPEIVSEYSDGITDDQTDPTTPAESEMDLADTESSLDRGLLQTLMENSPDAIYFKDLQSKFIRINRTLARRFHLMDPSEAIGKTDFDFFTQSHADEAFKDEQELIRTGIPIVDKEEKETWLTGTESWASTTKLPMRNDRGDIIGTFGISRSITERRINQQQLLQAEKLSSLARLISGVAHELNNPLTSVIGYTQLLLRDKSLDRPRMEKLEVILREAERTKDIVHSLLSFARQHSPYRCEVDVHQLMDTILQIRTYDLRINNISVIREYSSKTMITADPHQLQQIFLNLIINAEQAIRESSRQGIITVRTESIAIDNGARVKIIISDNGSGIMPEHLSKIFDPFFTTRPVGSGTGLGLSISYGIINDHGGSISVESEYGQGSKFIIELPAHATGHQ